MLRLCLVFLAGAAASSRLPWLPPEPVACILLVAAFMLALPRRARPLAALLAGSALYLHAAAATLDGRLPRTQHGQEFKFTAQIIDFTKVNRGRLGLLVAPDDAGIPARLRLAWYDAPELPRFGERWQFIARLKVPRGSRNPGGFDFTGWLHRQRIAASGYVLAGQRLAARPQTLSVRLRREAARRIEALLPAGDASAALLAIGVGARHRMTRAAWQRYAVTGTSHLMAISGLHVGLAAGAAGLLGWGLFGLLTPRANLRDLATLVALPAAAGYAALSGFAVPAQRALLMAMAAAALLVSRRLPRPPAILAVVAALVVLAEPLALLAPGFWLSFGAVAVLLAVARRERSRPESRSVAPRWLRELGVLQLALLLGLFPLTAFLFGRSSWLSPFANLVALPVFSVVTVPATLLGLLLTGPAGAVGDALLWLAWYSLRAVLALLAALAMLPGSDLALAAPRGAARALYLLPALWVLLPPGFPGRHLAWLAFAAALAYRPAAPPPGCVDVHTLDVGQGLAVVLRTARHTLLFDTGPAYRGGGSAARAIVPFLQGRGISRIDRLVISHADQDHAGGAADIARALPIADVLAGEPRPAVPAQRACRRGQRWRWDGVQFRVLHPDLPSGVIRSDGNDSSCVLEAAAGDVRVLLTGDIGAGVERRLVEGGALAPAALVQVPHHGSRTSSSPAFVAALSAGTAVVSAGFENRWGFPKPDVAARWQAAGARLMTTAGSGAIHHRLCPDRGATLLGEHRKAARRYWHDSGD